MVQKKSITLNFNKAGGKNSIIVLITNTITP